MGATTKNRIAVVTGAGRGLGREVALRLADEGSKVALVARSSEQVNEAAAAIVQGGGTAIAIAADISTSVGSQLVKTKIESEFGPPSILINAAGISTDKSRGLGIAPDRRRGQRYNGAIPMDRRRPGLQEPIASWDAPEDNRPWKN